MWKCRACTTHALAAGVLILATGAATAATPVTSDVPGVSLQVGANFYPMETWSPGKVRRWMSNDGQATLVNDNGRAESINLRFYAEAYGVPRELRIVMTGRLLAQWTIQPVAQRWIVLKALSLEPGRHGLVFQSVQPPLVPARTGKSTDERPLSVAFSPFTIIPAATLEAQMEWTGAFAAGPADSQYLTPLENRGQLFNREGRFLEAAGAYEQALAAGGTDFAHLLYGLTLLTLDRTSDARRVFRQCVALPGGGARRAWIRDLCGRAAAYVDESPLIAQRERDPGRSARVAGRIYEAVDIYERAVAQDPDAIHARYWLGVINAVAARRAAARGHLERVIALVGDTPDGRFLKALRPYF